MDKTGGRDDARSLRKRPLEIAEGVEHTDSGVGDAVAMATKYPAGTNAVLDEIELHFQRSLAQPKTKRKPTDDNSRDSNGGSHDVVPDPGRAPQKLSVKETLGSTAASVIPVTSESTSVPLKTPNCGVLPPLPSLIKAPHLDTVVTTNTIISAMPQKKQWKVLGQSSASTDVASSGMVDVLSPTVTRVSGTTGQTETVQVIDLTKHSSSDTQVARNGISSMHATTLSSPLLNQVCLSSSEKVSRHIESNPVTSVLTRNGSATPNKVGVSNPVILVPPGSAMMMQPQPYILMNPTPEISPVNHSTLIGSPNIFCGAGSGYILVTPSNAVPNSLLQVVSSAGVTAPVAVSSPHTSVSTPKQPTLTPNSTKLACTSFVSDDGSKDDMNVMPASVEDHFAKALGDEWSKLNSSCKVSSSSSTVTT